MLMTRLLPLLFLSFAAAAAGDTSGVPSSADPRKFKEIARYTPPQTTWMVLGGGKTIITQNPDGSVGVVDVATGKALGSLKGHASDLHDAGYSRDGRFLVTAGMDGQDKIWDLTTMKEIASIGAHAGFS